MKKLLYLTIITLFFAVSIQIGPSFTVPSNDTLVHSDITPLGGLPDQH